MGKAYANRKPVEERPESDFYATPISLVWELLENEPFSKECTIYEPADGEGNISKTLISKGYDVDVDDIRTTGKNFLECDKKYNYIITNPPFSLFDQFVEKAKDTSDKFAFIIKSNFFGAYKRHQNGIWKGLQTFHIFNRQVDYRTPFREDGLFHVGNLVTGRGVWDRNWKEDYFQTKILDVNKYAKLGQFKG